MSISAVSRTFTEGASVSDEDAASACSKPPTALGYRPNHLARSLMTGRTALIGLVSNHFANPAFMDVFDLFTRELQARGLRPLLANLGEDEDGSAALDMLAAVQRGRRADRDLGATGRLRGVVPRGRIAGVACVRARGALVTGAGGDGG